MKENKYDDNIFFQKYSQMSRSQQGLAGAGEWETLRKLLQLCGGSVLEVPMRWSEDFGHYLYKKKGAFFGIGAGEDYPPLHTEHYEYPDGLLQPTVDVFWKIMNS